MVLIITIQIVTYLKKKVIYRYRNHKIIDKSYLRLVNYINIFKFNGLNFDSDMSYEFFQVSPDFDDRLEIWLLKNYHLILQKK